MFLVHFSIPPLLFDSFFFFFNDTATTEIYTLSLHDALPIFLEGDGDAAQRTGAKAVVAEHLRDRKSTRLNLQSRQYLVCRLLLEKKKKKHHTPYQKKKNKKNYKKAKKPDPT